MSLYAELKKPKKKLYHVCHFCENITEHELSASDTQSTCFICTDCIIEQTYEMIDKYVMGIAKTDTISEDRYLELIPFNVPIGIYTTTTDFVIMRVEPDEYTPEGTFQFAIIVTNVLRAVYQKAYVIHAVGAVEFKEKLGKIIQEVFPRPDAKHK